MILGLTGGMGCGKTTAARMFAEHGFDLLDSDAIVRSILSTDQKVIDEKVAKLADPLGTFYRFTLPVSTLGRAVRPH